MSEIYNFTIEPQDERYYNNESNWGIYSFTTKDDIPELIEFQGNTFGEEPIVENGSFLVGKMQKLYIGSQYEITATCDYNAKYKQFQYVPISITSKMPKTVREQEKFLKALVTKRQAEALLSVYPDIIHDILSGKVENINLKKVKGIGKLTWEIIKEKVVENYVISDIIVLLQPLGVTFNMIKKLLSHESNPELLKAKLLDDPYLMTKIHGLGFKRVDELALKLVPELRVSTKRTAAFVRYYLKSMGEQYGHTWVLISTLDRAVRDNIGECFDIYKKMLQNNNFLYINDSKIGLISYRNVEENVFRILKELQGYKTEIKDMSGIEISQKEQGFKYTEEQIDVIQKALKDNVVLITGKAGTSKTTIGRAIINILKLNDLSVACCALSAKAAQRIIEATGANATTIHRLLVSDGLDNFIYNQNNQLQVDAVYVDECSMINAKLFYDLLLALKPGTKLILCGDHMQLPPIGYGNVFSDLLQKTDVFNVNKLTKVFRQAEMSGIKTDANLIREGINPLKSPELKIVSGELKDMLYMFRENREGLNNIAINTFIKTVKGGESLDDIVIIVPRKKECINSTTEINKKIQDILIDDTKDKIIRGNMVYKVGAKVIQRENNRDKNVYNGEIGYVEKIMISPDSNKEVCVVKYKDFQSDIDKIVTYTKEELIQIDLAYAITTHLSQGSGYNTVIGIVDSTHHILLDSCMLYTLLTRAKKRALLLAEPNAFMKCVRTNNNITRQTWLKDL